MIEFETKQADTLKGWERARAGKLDPHDAAVEILGHLLSNNALVYLFRRFGYPRFGWAWEVDIVQYHLTTPDPDVYLSVGLRDEGVYFGYCLSSKGCVDFYKDRDKHNEMASDDNLWFGSPPKGVDSYRYTAAIEVAMADLLRPVMIYSDDGETFANIKGYVDLVDGQAFLEPSPMAGYGGKVAK